MKKYGLIFCLCLLSATNVKAGISHPCDLQYYDDTYPTYWDTLNNQCSGCGDGCMSCRERRGTYSDGITPLSAPFCLECFSGYELQSANNGAGVTHQWCDRKKSCPSNCSACSSSSSCTLCNNGYTLSNGQCVEKVACPSNCAECDSSGVCVKCNNGYVLKNGACAVKPKTQIAFCPPDKTLSADLCCCISQ